MCNSLHNVRPINLEIKQGKSRDQTKKDCEFLRNCAGVRHRNCAGIRHCVILVAPGRVRKINQSIEVGTSEHRVLIFGLVSGWRAHD